MKRWIAISLVLSLWCGMLSGCTIETVEGKKGTESSSGYYLYEINESETDIQKKEYTPSDLSTEGMIRELEQIIGNTNPNMEKLNLLPEGVTISNHELSQNILTLNFDISYKDMSIIREMLVRAALVSIFLQVPEVSAVKIKVSGQELTDSKGQVIGPMNQESFAGQMGSERNDYQFISLTLYFTDKTGSVLVPETRKLYYSSNLSKERVVLEQLLKGPTEEGHYPTLPSDLSILSAVNSDGVCYINFGEEFAEETSSALPEVVIYSIVNSIVQVCNVEKVQISIEGDSIRMFRDTMELNKFYELNEELLQKTEAVH